MAAPIARESFPATALAPAYLIRMSFLTDFTPPTVRVTSTAFVAAACELTKPLSCTTPLKVSTLISATFSEGSFRMADFTLVVIIVSSTYSPVLSCFGVDAQPATDTSATTKNRGERYLPSLVIVLVIVLLRLYSKPLGPK